MRLYTIEFREQEYVALECADGRLCPVVCLGVMAATMNDLIDQADTLAVALCQCISDTVLDTESYMMNALVTFIQPFLNSALR